MESFHNDFRHISDPESKMPARHKHVQSTPPKGEQESILPVRLAYEDADPRFAMIQARTRRSILTPEELLTVRAALGELGRHKDPIRTSGELQHLGIRVEVVSKSVWQGLNSRVS